MEKHIRRAIMDVQGKSALFRGRDPARLRDIILWEATGSASRLHAAD